MSTRRRLLTAAMSLAVLFSAAGCATTASGEGGAGGTRKPAKEREVTGKVVGKSPCGTLLAIEVANADAKTGEGSKATKMRFFGFDAEVRGSVRGLNKGDTVRVQYIFSPDTQRNHPKKIEKVAEKSG